ncbi:hypothetical protein [Chryseobacterium caseinilyticum]|uniref:DUF4234 domain-containing protein n=1 Tax=Chryseobacterium caseinilyticum TaxID=2771428 RepID=A0ABR8ZF66_9FLAO|nr:hypothetical protein [Chryseobacterium caseinilyticum]MBD8083862.1 hypothetical protein [Chryseobacterium caseinilyticum]
MNNVEIISYINAKKKSKLYIENEIRGAQQVLSDLKEQKPVRWYHNAYYIGKRILFLSLAAVAFLFLISTLVDKEAYRNYFDNHYDDIVAGYLNDNFGTKSEITVSQISAVDSNVQTSLSVKEIRTELKEKLVAQVFDYALLTLQITLVVFTLVFWYIARLTRQLHLKNRQILDHYEVNISLMNLYQDVVQEQNYEIDFLEKATASNKKI